MSGAENGCPRRSWANLPFFCFSGSQQIGWYPLTLVKGSSLLSLLIQITISSSNVLKDTSSNNVSPTIWASFSSIKLTHKINHYTQARTPWDLLCSDPKFRSSPFIVSLGQFLEGWSGYFWQFVQLFSCYVYRHKFPKLRNLFTQIQ